MATSLACARRSGLAERKCPCLAAPVGPEGSPLWRERALNAAERLETRDRGDGRGLRRLCSRLPWYSGSARPAAAVVCLAGVEERGPREATQISGVSDERQGRPARLFFERSKRHLALSHRVPLSNTHTPTLSHSQHLNSQGISMSDRGNINTIPQKQPSLITDEK